MRPHALTRVATENGRVLAGAMGIPVPQFFGGRAVPSACVSAVCVAPEARGRGIAGRLMAELVRGLRDEHGAAAVSLWTPSVGLYRRWGWGTIATPCRWVLPAAQLREFRRTTAPGLGIVEGVHAFQQEEARAWNGPVRRPAWWWEWKRATAPATTYHLTDTSGEVTGYLTATTAPVKPWGHDMFVHELAARDRQSLHTLIGFLGEHASQVQDIHLGPTATPVLSGLLDHLSQFSARARTWYPWMLALVDPVEAVRARGWDEDLDVDLVLSVADPQGRTTGYRLSVHGGAGRLETTGDNPDVELTSGHLAAWYAGAFGSPARMRVVGVRGRPAALRRLSRTTDDREPWLPDTF
nr:GNAT family N-acetyltransferase [Streptomyces sp. SID3343]